MAITNMSSPTDDAITGNMLYIFEYDQTFLVFMDNANIFVRLFALSASLFFLVAPSMSNCTNPAFNL